MSYWHNKTFCFIIIIGLTLISTFVMAQKYPEEELGWKLGAQAYSFRKFSFYDAIQKTDSCNLRFIEAYPGQIIGGGIEGTMDFNMSPEKRKEILDLLKAKGVTLYAFGVVGADSPEAWRQLFVFSKAMGIQNINVEPEEKDMPLIGKLANEFKINVSIHNHPKPTHYWNPKTVLAAIKLANSSYVGACADIGHWIRSGLDPIECLKEYSGHINHLHFKDLNALSPEAHDVQWGTGVSNVKAIIQELKRQQFKGMLSAEYEYNWYNNAPDIAASVKNFRRIVKELKN